MTPRSSAGVISCLSDWNANQPSAPNPRHSSDDEPAKLQTDLDDAHVEIRQTRSEAANQSVIVVALFAGTEFCSEHWTDGQRDRRRDRHGERQHESEFREQAADDAGHERDRNENGGERRRRRHDGEHDLLCTENGGRARSGAHGAMAGDVLDDDDGVVDDEAGGDDQAPEASGY